LGLLVAGAGLPAALEQGGDVGGDRVDADAPAGAAECLAVVPHGFPHAHERVHRGHDVALPHPTDDLAVLVEKELG